MSNKEPIVHFEGKDMPASEWLQLIALRDAARRAWNEPDPAVVTLKDGRKVMREFYDPALHGPEVE